MKVKQLFSALSLTVVLSLSTALPVLADRLPSASLPTAGVKGTDGTLFLKILRGSWIQHLDFPAAIYVFPTVSIF